MPKGVSYTSSGFGGIQIYQKMYLNLNFKISLTKHKGDVANEKFTTTPFVNDFFRHLHFVSKLVIHPFEGVDC